MYSINFIVKKKKPTLQWTKQLFICKWYRIFKFKAKNSEIVASPFCLGNISKDYSVDNMKKTGFNGYVYDFSVDNTKIIFY